MTLNEEHKSEEAPKLSDVELSKKILEIKQSYNLKCFCINFTEYIFTNFVDPTIEDGKTNDELISILDKFNSDLLQLIKNIK